MEWIIKIVHGPFVTIDCAPPHRRKKKTEEKSKVVAAVWRTELIQFLTALAVLHKDDLKKRINRMRAMAEWMLWKNG